MSVEFQQTLVDYVALCGISSGKDLTYALYPEPIENILASLKECLGAGTLKQVDRGDVVYYKIPRAKKEGDEPEFVTRSKY